MIKVNDINNSNELNAAKGVKKSAEGPSFSSFLSQTVRQSAAEVGGMNGVSIANAILAVQQAGGEEEKQRRQKLVKRGSQLLDKLEEIRDALLLGYMDREKLIDIARLVKENRPETSDPRLQEIIAEIDLRVEVELAKLTK